MNKLMTKLFSDPEFADVVAEKVQEAKDNGSAELVTESENLQFADAGDEGVIVEDQTADEVTSIKEDPVDPTKLVAEEVKIPVEEKVEAKCGRKFSAEVEAPKDNSKTQPDIEVKRVEGKDGDKVSDTAPDVKIDADAAVIDAELADSREFSLRLSKLEKSFSEVMDKIDKVIEKLDEQGEVAAKVAKDGEVSPETEEFLSELNNKFTKTYSLVERAKKYGDPETIAEAKKAVEECKEDITKAENDGIKVDEKSKEPIADMEADLNKAEDAVKEEVRKECGKTFGDKDVEEEEKPEDKPEEGEKKPEEDEKKPEEDEMEEAKKSFSQVLNSRFDSCDVSPKVIIESNRTFSSKTKNNDTVENPFLFTNFN